MAGRSILDSRDSFEIGQRAEDLFAHIATARGWSVVPADPKEDRDEHWDFVISRWSYGFLVDVKSRKRRSRRDDEFEDDWTWIELHGRRFNDPGWLLSGQAELIAFETPATFLIIERLKLARSVAQLVQFNTISFSADTADYAIYQRRMSSPDRLTLIETSKIRAIKWDEWSKASGFARSIRVN